MTPIIAKAETYITITSLTELPLDSNGTIKENFVEIKNDKEFYDLTIISNNGKIYKISEYTFPPVYDRNKVYEINYEVITIDDEKTVFVDFIYSSDESIRWKVNDGQYLYHNVVTVTKSEIDHVDGFFNTSPYRHYYIHFNLNTPMDHIYQIDVSYYTRVGQLGIYGDWLKVDDTLYYKELDKSKNGFEKWIAKYYIGMPEMTTISASRLDNYTWQAHILSDLGSKPSLLPVYIYPNREFKSFKLLKFYYLYDGIYKETTKVHDSGTDYTFSEWENILNDFKLINTNLNNFITKISNNKDTIILIIYLVIFLVLIGPLFFLLSVILKPIIFSLKTIITIIKLPFKLIFNRSSRS